MKIGVVSDTHISSPSDPLPPEMLARFRKENVELILHAGDIVHHRVLDELSKTAEVRAVAGNMDPPELKASLPKRLVIEAGGLRIGLVHGSGPPTRLGERLLPTFDGDEIDALVYGHSHGRQNDESKGVLLFNPGSAQAARDGGQASYGILTIEDGHVFGEIVRIP